MKRNKTIFNKKQRIEIYILEIISRTYGVIAGKQEYKISFKIFNHIYEINRELKPVDSNSHGV